LDSFFFAGNGGGIKSEYDCIKAFSETDFTDDLRKINVPTLIIQGDDDQIVDRDCLLENRQDRTERQVERVRGRAARASSNTRRKAQCGSFGVPQELSRVGTLVKEQGPNGPLHHEALAYSPFPSSLPSDGRATKRH
jgi:hypothetical protein